MVTILKKGTDKNNIRKLLKELIKKAPQKGIDTYKYCGAIQLKKDALTIQKQLRNEWN